MARCASCNNEIPGGSAYCPMCAAPVDAATSAPTESGVGGEPAMIGSGSLPEPARFIPGTVIDNRYRIVGLLGRGGMGEVYRADDLKLGQPVALKFLPRDVMRDRVRLDRFLNEVRTALKVTHTNVCRVHDIGEIDGQHYLSMEYVDGEDLASLLRRIGRLPEDKAILIGATAGLFNSSWWALYDLVVDRFSLAAGRPSTTWLASLSSLSETVGLWFDMTVWSLYIAIGWLFLVLLLRVLLRRQWIAMAVLMVVWVGSWIPGHSNPLIFGAFASVSFTIFLLVLTRFGLLSTVFWALFLWAGQYVVLTLSTTAWYAGRSWLTLLLLAAVACYGFWISLAGRPLIKADLLEER